MSPLPLQFLCDRGQLSGFTDVRSLVVLLRKLSGASDMYFKHAYMNNNFLNIKMREDFLTVMETASTF